MVVGLMFSPVTAISHLRISGAQSYDKGRLADIADGIRRRPAMRVNEQSVQSVALENPAVASASYRANLFGRGVLTVRYHTPVAAIMGRDGLYLSDRGTIFSSPQRYGPMMVVKPPIDANETNLALFSGWQGGSAARMCVRITDLLPGADWQLTVSSTGYVSLVADGGLVEFGSFDNAEKKVAKLAELLAADPDMLSRAVSLNLSDPNDPTYVPRP